MRTDREHPVPSPYVIIILAAGKGKRMKNPEIPKVLHEVNGRPMVDYVLDLALQLGPLSTLLVVGHQRDAVVEHVVSQFGEQVKFVEQERQLGTGHAVLQAEKELESFSGDLMVLSGDVPLLAVDTVRRLILQHQREDVVATILTAEVENPSGYGRIVRQLDGAVERIVEDLDATEREKAIREINSGIYVFRKLELFSALRQLRPSNLQKEYYLTDVFELFRERKLPVIAVKVVDSSEVRGINTAEELTEAEETLQKLTRKGIRVR